MLFARESEAVNDFFNLVLGVLDAFGNLNFLLPVQQRHLAHLLQIHPHRVVQNVQPRLFVLLLRFGYLDSVHLSLIHNFHFEVSKLNDDLIHLLRTCGPLCQAIVDVVVREVTLFLRQSQQLPDLFRQRRTDVRIAQRGFGDGRGRSNLAVVNVVDDRRGRAARRNRGKLRGGESGVTWVVCERTCCCGIIGWRWNRGCLVFRHDATNFYSSTTEQN